MVFKGISKALAVAAALALSPLGLADKPDKVDVIIGFKDKPGAAERARVESLGGAVRRDFNNFPMQAISIPKKALEGLKRGKGVRFVVPDRPTEALSASALATAGLPGAGSANSFPVDPAIGIAVLDSGVAAHADLGVLTRLDCTAPAVSPPPRDL